MGVTFYIPGKPIPQGSKRWTGKAMIEANSNLRPWRQAVTICARDAMSKATAVTFPYDEPLMLVCEFTFLRPKGHYGTGRNSGKLKPNAPVFVTSTPDLDKLVRAVQDGITDAGLWRDDSQVVNLQAQKRYGEQAGVTVTVYSYAEMFRGAV